MTNSLLKTLLLSLCLSCSYSFASERPHSIDLDANIGVIVSSHNQATEELNDLSTSHGALSYNYQIYQQVMLGVGYLRGDSSDFSLSLDAFTDSRLEYDALFVQANFQLPLSKRNLLFADVKVLKYNYDIINDDKVSSDDGGTDIGLSVGWQYKFDSGFGLKASYDDLSLGADISIDTFSLGISYHF
jgi:hypothetical protein